MPLIGDRTGLTPTARESVCAGGRSNGLAGNRSAGKSWRRIAFVGGYTGSGSSSAGIVRILQRVGVFSGSSAGLASRRSSTGFLHDQSNWRIDSVPRADFNLVMRELKARYKSSVLGFFWSLLNPLGMMLVFTFVFTVMAPNSQIVTSLSSSCVVFCPGSSSAAA